MTTAQDRLNAILPIWFELLQQWSIDGSLALTAEHVLDLDGENAVEGADDLLQSYTSQWSLGDFESLPPIVLLSNDDISGAQGAYAASTDTIYLNDDWLLTATEEQIIAVLTEELGAFLDDQLKTVDTQGDEGALFSAELLGVSLSDAQFAAIQAESDYITINVVQQETQAEANTSSQSLTLSPITGDDKYIEGVTLKAGSLQDSSGNILPIASYQWFLNGEPIISATDSRYETQTGEAGYYYVEVQFLNENDTTQTIRSGTQVVTDLNGFLPADIAPPAIKSLSLDQTVYDLSRPGTVYTNATLSYSDNLSGFNYAEAQYTHSLTGDTIRFYFSNFSSTTGNSFQGTSQSSSKLNLYNIDGAYNLTSLQATDEAGNALSLQGLELDDFISKNNIQKSFEIVNATADTSSASINSLTLNSSLFDVSQNGGVFLKASIDVSDDISGFQYGNAQYIEFNTGKIVSFYFGGSPVPPGTTAGTFYDYVFADINQAPGIYELYSLSATDYAGNYIYLDGADLNSLTSSNGIQTSFEITGSLTDTFNPIITSLQLDNAFYDPSQQGGVYLNATLKFSDKVSGFDYASVTYSDPNTSQNVSFYFYSDGLGSGSILSGSSEATTTLNYYASNEVYELTQLHIADKAGNSLFLYGEQLSEFTSTNVDIQKDFTVQWLNSDSENTSQDISAPVITSITLDKAGYDVTANNQKVLLTATFEDDLSGFDYLQLAYRNVSSNDILYIYASIVSGIDTSGTAKGSLLLDKATLPGDYLLETIFFSDKNSNSIMLTRGSAEFEDFTKNNIVDQSLSIVNDTPVDTAPPDILSFTLNKSIYDISEFSDGSNFSIEGTFTFSDDISGIRRLNAAYQNDFGDYIYITSSNFSDSTFTKGTVFGSQTLSKYTPTSEFKLVELSAVDQAGNTYYYSQNEIISLIESNSVQSTFSVVNTSLVADTSPPDITNFSLDSFVYDASVPGGTNIQLTLDFKDDTSGISSGSASFINRRTGTKLSIYLSTVSGTSLSGSLSGSALLDASSANGLYELESLYVSDKQGNSVNYPYNDDLSISTQANNFQTDFTVVNAQNLPPSAISFENVNTQISTLSNTSSDLFIANIVIYDDLNGQNKLELNGIDAEHFILKGNSVYLKAGTVIDFVQKNSYSFFVTASDPYLPNNLLLSDSLFLDVKNPESVSLYEDNISPYNIDIKFDKNSYNFDIEPGVIISPIVSASDDLSGIEGGYMQFTGPNNSTIYFDFDENTSLGSPLESDFFASDETWNDYEFRNYASGVYTLSSFNIRDKAGNEVTYIDDYNYYRYGYSEYNGYQYRALNELLEINPELQTSFEVINSNVDLVGPTISAITLNSYAFDFTDGVPEINITVDFIDDISGVNEIYLTFKNGENYLFYDFNFRDSDDDSYFSNILSSDGILTNGSVTFTANYDDYRQEGQYYLPSGTWNLDYISITDKAGNNTFYSSYPYSYDEGLGELQSSFDIYNPNSDIDAPVLNSISVSFANDDFSATSLDPSVNGQNVILLDLDISDNLSGIDSVWLNFTNLTTNEYFYVDFYDSYYFDNLDRHGLGIDNSITSLISQKAVLLDPWMSSGTWILDSISMDDVAGNYTYYSRNLDSYSSNPEVPYLSFDVQNSFSSADEIDPLIVISQSVDSSRQSDGIYRSQLIVDRPFREYDEYFSLLYINNLDYEGLFPDSFANYDSLDDSLDYLGVSTFSFGFESYNFESYQPGVGYIYESIIYNPYVSPSDWVLGAYIYDSDNTSTYNYFFESDWQSFVDSIDLVQSFEVVNSSSDNEAPQVLSLSVDSTNANFAFENQFNYLVFDLDIQDNLSGFDYAYFTYASSKSSQLISIEVESSDILRSEPKFVFLGEYTASGDWSLQSVELYDKADNFFYMDNLSVGWPDFLNNNSIQPGFVIDQNTREDLSSPEVVGSSVDVISYQIGLDYEVKLQASLELTDNLSGVGEAELIYSNLLNDETVFFEFYRDSFTGSRFDAVGRSSVTVNPNFSAGTWELQRIKISDIAGNIFEISSSDSSWQSYVEANSLQSSFIVEDRGFSRLGGDLFEKDGRYLLFASNDDRPVFIQDSGGNFFSEASSSDWNAVAGKKNSSGDGYRVLVDGADGGAYAGQALVWIVDGNGTITGNEGGWKSGIDLWEWEVEFGVELNDQDGLGAVVTPLGEGNDLVLMGGLYAVRDSSVVDSTPVLLRSGGTTFTDASSPLWNAVAAKKNSSGDGYRVLVDGADGGALAGQALVWTVDRYGTITGSEGGWKSGIDLWEWEVEFGVDLSDEEGGVVGFPDPVVVKDDLVTMDGLYALRDSSVVDSTPVLLRSGGTTFSDASSPDWNAVAAKKNSSGDGYRVLVDGADGGVYAGQALVWTVDGNGTITGNEGGWKSGIDVWDWEVEFGVELNDQTGLGAEVKPLGEGNDLVLMGGLYAVRDSSVVDSTPVLLRVGGTTFSDASSPLWNAVAAKKNSSGDGYRVLVDGADGGALAGQALVWIVDGNGTITGSEGGWKSGIDLWEWEVEFGVDLSDEEGGVVGFPDPVVVKDDLVLMGGLYAVRDSSVVDSTPVLLRSGGTIFSDASSPLWNAVAAKKNSSGDGYRVLVDGADGGAYAGQALVWIVDGNGTITGNEGGWKSGIDVWDWEVEFGVELNDQTGLGAEVKPLGEGNDLVLMGGLYAVRDASVVDSTPVLLRSGGTILSDASSPLWNAVAAKKNSSGDGYRVLVDGTDGGAYAGQALVWIVDGNGTITGNEGGWKSGIDVWEWEVEFGVELNDQDGLGAEVTPLGEGNDLVLMGGLYAVQDSSAENPSPVLLRSGGTTFSDASSPDWNAVAAKKNSSGDGYRVLVDGADGGALAGQALVWTVDGNGTITGSEGGWKSGIDVWEWEDEFKIELNDQDGLGAEVTPLGEGNDLVLMGGLYAVQDSSAENPSPVLLRSGGTTFTDASSPLWNAVAAKKNSSGDGYRVLVDGADGGAYAGQALVWTVDGNGTITGNEGGWKSGIDVWEWEVEFGVELNDQTGLGAEVTPLGEGNDLVLMGGLYAVRDSSVVDSSPVLLRSGVSTFSDASSPLWNAVAAQKNSSGDGYRVLVDGADGGAYAGQALVWIVDGNGTIIGSEGGWKSGIDVWDWEVEFGVELNDQTGLGAEVTPLGEGNDLVLMGGFYGLKDSNDLNFLIKYINSVFSDETTDLWNAVAARRQIDGSYRVLLDGSTGLAYSGFGLVWEVDRNGYVIATDGGWKSGIDVWEWEVEFGVELNDQTGLGAEVTPLGEGNDLVLMGGLYAVQDSSAENPSPVLLRSGGTTFTDASSPLWNAVAAKKNSSGDGYRVLVDGTDGGAYAGQALVWTVDGNGAIIGSEGGWKSGIDVWDWEVEFGVELNDQTGLGAEVTPLGEGNDLVLMGGFYAVQDSSAENPSPVLLRSGGTTFTDASSLLWNAVAANKNSSGDGYRALVDGTDGGAYAGQALVWTVDGNGTITGSEGGWKSGIDVWDWEVEFGVELNDDEILGSPDNTVTGTWAWDGVDVVTGQILSNNTEFDTYFGVIGSTTDSFNGYADSNENGTYEPGVDLFVGTGSLTSYLALPVDNGIYSGTFDADKVTGSANGYLDGELVATASGVGYWFV